MGTAVLARLVLAEARTLGLGLADLLAAAELHTSMPTLTDWVAEVEPTFTPATATTYRPYWRLAVDLFGDRRVCDLALSELHAVVEAAGERARRNRPGTTGQSSRETCVAALRALYRRALDVGLVATNPAASLTKPRRPRSRRRALDDIEQAELVAAVRATSPDPTLDLLLVRFHLETGARRAGALGVRRVERSAVAPGDYLLRRHNGRPVTPRDYDRLFTKARFVLPWAARTPVSAHVLRHTAITAIARIAGYPVAQAFAGHAPTSVTGRYIYATPSEIAAAVAVMTGERHPLADRLSTRCGRR